MSQTGAPKPPDIFNYSNYRQYLRDYFDHRKAVDGDFSVRSFAREAGFPSHGLINYVLAGKRNLSKKTLVKVSVALGLKDEASHFFENLVFFNQAKTLQEKDFFYQRLLKSPAKSTFRKLESSQLQIFRKWYTVVVREMLNLKAFRKDATWISNQLWPHVEPFEVDEALELLLSSGLIKKTANGYRAADPDITTDDEVSSFLVKAYHAQLMKLTTWSLDEVPPKERDVSSVCFAIKESELPNLKKQLQLVRKELRAFAAPDREGDRIVQVNIQLMPLTRGKPS